MGQFFKRMWEHMKWSVDEDEKDCSHDMEKEVKGSARRYHVSDGEKLKSKLNRANEKSGQLANDELDKAQKAVGDVTRKSAKGSKNLDEQARLLKDAGEEMEKAAKKGFVDAEKMEKSEERLQEVKKGACSEKQGKVSSHIG